MGWDRTACRRSAGLPRLAWVHPIAARIFQALFGVTMKGATVVIADAHSAPAETVHPGLFFTRSGEESEPIPAGNLNGTPINLPVARSPDCQQRGQNGLCLS